MIKVERAPKPEKLTDELQSQLTEEFKKDNYENELDHFLYGLLR